MPAVGSSSSLFRWASGACCRDQFIPLLVCLWCLLSGPVHPSSGGLLVPAVGTSSSLFWCVSGACCRVQFIPLLVCIWCLLSGPVHPSSGVYLVSDGGTSPSLFWWASGACYRDQFILLLVGLWSLLSRLVHSFSGVYLVPVSEPVHPSSGGLLVPAVRTSSSLFWWASGACCRDQFIPLLVGLWSLLSGPVHQSSCGPLMSSSSSVRLLPPPF